MISYGTAMAQPEGNVLGKNSASSSFPVGPHELVLIYTSYSNIITYHTTTYYIYKQHVK